MEVHRHLGPGLDGDAYCDCLALELRMKEIVHRRNAALPFRYKGLLVEPGARVDFLVEETLLLSVVRGGGVDDAHKERLRHLLRLTGYEVGLLVDFNVTHLRDGVRRMIVAPEPPVLHYREEPAVPVLRHAPGPA